MYDKFKSDSESSDEGEECEYNAQSTIKSNWLQNYESGNFGDDFPSELQKKKDEPKSVSLSQNDLMGILQKVRDKQNTQKPKESSAAQDAITAIIGTNATGTQQISQPERVLQNGIDQMTPANNIQPVQQHNFPLPYKPLVNAPSGYFAPTSNLNPISNPFLPNFNVPTYNYNQQLPVPPAANAYYQQPAHYGSHNRIPVRLIIGNAPGLPLIIPPQVPSQNIPMNSPNANYLDHSRQQHFVPQPGMPHQNILPPNMPPSNMLQPNQNVSMPHGMQMMNTQRPSDPRLRERLQAPPKPIVQNGPVQFPSETRPEGAMPMAAPIKNRRRISLYDYRRVREYGRYEDNDEQMPDQNESPVNEEQRLDRNGTVDSTDQRNGHEIPPSNERADEQSNNEDANEVEPTFSPTSESPASSPATEPNGSPIPNENDENKEEDEEMANVVAHEVTVKTEDIQTEQNEDYESDASDATVEFTYERFKEDHQKSLLENKDNGVAAEVFGDMSPQYIVEEEPESEEQANPEPEEKFQMNNEADEAEEIGQQSDSEELLVPVQQRPVDQTKRCYIILEDIGHLLNQHNTNIVANVTEKKKKMKIKKVRRRAKQLPDTKESESEHEPEQTSPVVTEERVYAQAPAQVLQHEPEPIPAQEIERANEEVDADALSEIIISSDEHDDADDSNNNDNNNNNNNNNVIYEISSDSD
ncbi:GATA zinc finger domain-containing protein 10-like [Sitodiplosis mosellana]|uniref:GATA zinc finger domain-containing protein 10-like n=1 Tax=Sitodiplosis mosellana TaxID=263140 RepID=UPI002443C734|nr:GATA zinc finger domain-containing protein 10-like [Sitodiplosis mosellana]